MLQTHQWSISMWIVGLLRPLVHCMPAVASWACPRCGCAIDVRRTDGTSSWLFEINLSQQRLSPCKHVVGVTHGGKLSISCASSLSDEKALADSGQRDGICSTPTNFSRSHEVTGRNLQIVNVSADELAQQHGAGCVDELDDD